MLIKPCLKYILLIFVVVFSLSACKDGSTIKNIKEKISYKKFIERFKSKKTTEAQSDSTNIFDNDNYDPQNDSINNILNAIETVYEGDSALIKKIGADKTGILTNKENSIALKDTFTSDIRRITPEEIAVLKENLKALKAANIPQDPTIIKKQKDAVIWADVSKSAQRMYLYVNGELVDTFKISSGDKKHTTPNFDRRPSGPIFNKYSSKKYPGGNYNGFGNMPYVVFIEGGYALHGTTTGNIKKLGTIASHGCIRLHPDNAKIFNELVREAGIENTWVTVRD